MQFGPRHRRAVERIEERGHLHPRGRHRLVAVDQDAGERRAAHRDEPGA
jgi:hypothetical protein